MGGGGGSTIVRRVVCLLFLNWRDKSLVFYWLHNLQWFLCIVITYLKNTTFSYAHVSYSSKHSFRVALSESIFTDKYNGILNVFKISFKRLLKKTKFFKDKIIVISLYWITACDVLYIYSYWAYLCASFSMRRLTFL